MEAEAEAEAVEAAWKSTASTSLVTSVVLPVHPQSQRYQIGHCDDAEVQRQNGKDLVIVEIDRQKTVHVVTDQIAMNLRLTHDLAQSVDRERIRVGPWSWN